MMPGSDTSFFKHARAASTVWVDQVPIGGLFCHFIDRNVVVVELAHATGGREVVELFRNIIGTPACYLLCAQISHCDRHRPNKER
jgi:hypothetical protein